MGTRLRSVTLAGVSLRCLTLGSVNRGGVSLHGVSRFRVTPGGVRFVGVTLRGLDVCSVTLDIGFGVGSTWLLYRFRCHVDQGPRAGDTTRRTGTSSQRSHSIATKTIGIKAERLSN